MLPSLPPPLVLAHWVHNLDPVLFHLVGPLAVRWYGLSYLLGFLCGYLILRRLATRGELAVAPGDLSALILRIAIYGVFLGGRLGYVLLYQPDSLIDDPLFLFRVWEGGMASHGGMIGVTLVLLWTARKQQLPFWNLADGMALAAPAGLFFGRMANFINGELWGRPSTLPWAVIFPQAGDSLPRHPSQIYEALSEGLLLFAVLWILHRAIGNRREGVASAAFLILYALARITCEWFREPDSGLVLGILTKGQFYSSLMILGGASILLVKKPLGGQGPALGSGR